MMVQRGTRWGLITYAIVIVVTSIVILAIVL